MARESVVSSIRCSGWGRSAIAVHLEPGASGGEQTSEVLRDGQARRDDQRDRPSGVAKRTVKTSEVLVGGESNPPFKFILNPTRGVPLKIALMAEHHRELRCSSEAD